MLSSVQNPGRAAPAPRAAAAATAHPRLTIALHWTSAAIVLLAFSMAWSREFIDDDAPRRLLMTVHQTCGLLALALLMARLGARFARAPLAAPPLPPLLRWASLAGHAALYALLLAMPLLGWALANAHGKPVGLPGLFALPMLAGPDPDLADTLETWHKGLAWLFLATIASHVGAALYHHFIRRDQVLAAMWPSRRRVAIGRRRSAGTHAFPISESFR